MTRRKQQTRSLFDDGPELFLADQRTPEQRASDALLILETLQRCHPNSASSALLREKSKRWAEDLDTLRNQGHVIHTEKHAGGCLVTLEGEQG